LSQFNRAAAVVDMEVVMVSLVISFISADASWLKLFSQEVVLPDMAEVAGPQVVEEDMVEVQLDHTEVAPVAHMAVEAQDGLSQFLQDGAQEVQVVTEEAQEDMEEAQLDHTEVAQADMEEAQADMEDGQVSSKT
jgi:hypothetical protein